MNDDIFKEDFWDKPDLTEETESFDDSYMYEEEEEDEDDYLDELDDFEVEDLYEEVDRSSLMDDARIRLEQGRLYEMLIQHNLFDGVEAMPEAQAKVQQEIKDFIMERLEILLGMKAEKETEVHQVIQESQFNDLEVQVLRRVASKMSKGMTDQVSTPEPVVESALNTVKKEPKKVKINPLGERPTPKKQRPPENKAVAKKKKKRTLKKELRETSTEGLSIEEIARRDLKAGSRRGKMSLEQANELVEQRHSRPRKQLPADAQSYQNQVNSQYSTKMSMNPVASNFSLLLAAAKKK